MRILCVGGGPAGLYLALLMKRADARHQVRVVERNRAYDTFGWGVVFSDQTLGNLAAADPETAAEIAGASVRYRITCQIDTTQRGGNYDFEYESSLNPAPGLPGVLR
jgi:2-polyprenyl-6-methoxyphenol hydroxylase-like FAD-dependent oxidoreductase